MPAIDRRRARLGHGGRDRGPPARGLRRAPRDPRPREVDGGLRCFACGPRRRWPSPSSCPPPGSRWPPTSTRARRGCWARGIPGGVLRLGVAIVLGAGLALALRFRPAGRLPRGLRDPALPPLHPRLHEPARHHRLREPPRRAPRPGRPRQGALRRRAHALGRAVHHPARAPSVMQFFYVNFFWLAPSALARSCSPGGASPSSAPPPWPIMICFYLGYVLYVVFPAAPPRLVLATEYTKNLYGYPQFFSKPERARPSPCCPWTRAPPSPRCTPRSPCMLGLRVALTCGLVLDRACPSCSGSGCRPSTCGTTRGGPARGVRPGPGGALARAPDRRLVGGGSGERR